MFQDLVTRNRSYRGFDSTAPISREQLAAWVNCARLSPSGMNAQPLRYRLVTAADEVANVQSLVVWAAALSALHLPREGEGPTAFIVICHDTEVAMPVAALHKDVGITAQTMLLAAVSEGYGGCMIGNYAPQKIADALQLDAHLQPVLVIALGKPIETIELVEAAAGDSLKYYRDENNVHYVPKRKLEDIIL